MSSDIIIHNTNFKEVYATNEVAKNYQVTENTVRNHLSEHNDEFIENTHYFYTINPRFKTKILNWTLEGVYMLGFFIKSKQAKIYRKKVAEFLRLCDEARQKKFNEARATITGQTDKIENLEATVYGITKRFTSQINGYKWQAAVQKKKIKPCRINLQKLKNSRRLAMIFLPTRSFLKDMLEFTEQKKSLKIPKKRPRKKTKTPF